MFYILQCLKRLFFSFYNFAVQQFVEHEFNREVKAGFLFFFFLSESRCLEGFSYFPHSRQFLFAERFYCNGVCVSVCLWFPLAVELLNLGNACALFSSSGFPPFLSAASPSRLRFGGSDPKEGAGRMRTVSRATGLLLDPRGL